MKNLEAKHITSYFPHRLTLMWDGILYIYRAINDRGDCEIASYDRDGADNIEWVKLNQTKPNLRPLSDLTKEIEVNGKKFYPCHKFGLIESKQNQVHLERKINQQYISHLEITILFEWHFDVFGLIPEGLAIDINTLNKEQ